MKRILTLSLLLASFAAPLRAGDNQIFARYNLPEEKGSVRA